MTTAKHTVKTGDRYTRQLVISEELLLNYGILSGDQNPIHVDDEYAKEKGLKGKISYGNILGMMVSALVGMDLWSREVMLLTQSLKFRHPVYLGDTVKLTSSVTEKNDVLSIVELDLNFQNQHKAKLATGKIKVKCL